MEISIKLTTLLLATLLTGLSAGLCFTWTNSITAGLARLDDIGYLDAFQQMNRSILNPKFLIVFFGSFVIGLVTTIQHRSHSITVLWMLVGATAAYFIGVVLITVFGNVPLNEVLDKSELTQLSSTDAKALRELFEDKWTRLHLIRTYSSGISFLLLILVCLWRGTAM